MKVPWRYFAAVPAVGFGVLAWVYLTLPDVRPLATAAPETTAFMKLRAAEAEAAGKKARRVHRWVPYARISPNLRRAVLVAEDDAFFDHDGVDLEQIRQSFEQNLERGRFTRGGSTITQQLAKNLYLSPRRDPLRKLRELLIARRLEAALSKRRILELYLNLIEWGDGVWGAEAAARTYFGKPASGLTAGEAALLAGAIINPRVHSPARPTPRLKRRQQMILARMGAVTPPPVEPAVTVGVPAEAPAAESKDPVAPDGPAVDSPPVSEPAETVPPDELEPPPGEENPRG